MKEASPSKEAATIPNERCHRPAEKQIVDVLGHYRELCLHRGLPSTLPFVSSLGHASHCSQILSSESLKKQERGTETVQ